MPDPTAAPTLDKQAWDRIAEQPEFKSLLAKKRRFIIPACVFFCVYYFSLPVLVGYAPGFMSIKVWGTVNLAYLFALSQFVMAWVIAGLYVRVASSFDQSAAAIIQKLKNAE